MSGKTDGPSAYTIERCVAAWERAKASLENDPDLMDDENAIMSVLALDPASVSMDVLIQRLVRGIAFATSRSEEAKHMKLLMLARERRYTRRLMTMRTELFDIMNALGHKRFRALEGTVTIRKGVQSVVVVDEQAIPDEYFKTKRILNKKELLDDLKQGAVVEGALLSNGAESIQIGQIQPVIEPLGETDDDSSNTSEE